MSFHCHLTVGRKAKQTNIRRYNKLLDVNIDGNVVRVLAYWFSKQDVSVRWHSALSQSFSVGTGTRQGGVLSEIIPIYLFNRYIRDMLVE